MASDTSWGSWWTADGIHDLWNRVEASAEADWQALAGTAEAGYNSLSRGVAELFPSGGLAHFQISQYFHGSCANAAFEAPQAFLQRVVEEIKSSSWQGLESSANYIFGPTSVSLGIVYGLGESLAKDVWKLLGLAKMICLANLYAHLDSHSVLGSSDPLVWALANALDQLPGVHSEMRMAHDRMQELLRDLQEIVKHPKAFFQAVGKDISQEFQEDWKALTTYCEHPSLRHGFQLGKAVGRILYQLIMLLLIFEGAVKTATSIAAEFPRLARVARIVENGGRLADLEVPERMAAGGASAGDELAEGSSTAEKAQESLPETKQVTSPVDSKRSLTPGSPEHKAARWKAYQDRGGSWSYDRWSKQYDTNMENVSRGLAREQAYRDAMGGENLTVETPYTYRQIDIYRAEDDYMGQLKTGRESLTKDNALAIQKDAYLVQQGNNVEYILEKGASENFLKALDNANIPYKIGPQIP